MKKYKILAVVFFMFLIPICLNAEDINLKLARTLNYQKKYDEAAINYEKYLKTHSKDYKVVEELGDVYFTDKQFDEALKCYLLVESQASEKILKKIGETYLIKGEFDLSAKYYLLATNKNGKDIEAKIKLAQVLSYSKHYDESVAQYDAVLVVQPKNLQALREKADVLSWYKKYNESVDVYDKYLEIEYSSDVARQKARVLGWAKKYKQAIKSYDEAYTKTGKNEILLEKEGKQAFWNGWALIAIKKYRELLKTEPDNLEARFDLAQLEAYQRDYKGAEKDFGYIVKNADYHFRAKESLEKINVLRNSPTITPSFKWFRAKSGERFTHVDEISTGFTVSSPSARNFKFNAGYYFDYYMFNNAGSIPRQRGLFGADFSLGPYVYGNGSYIPISYTSDNRSSNLFDSFVTFRPSDFAIITAFAKREDLDNNRIVFDQKLHTTNFGARLASEIHRRLKLFANYEYNIINDDNNRNAFGVENLIYVSYEPYRLTVDLRLDYQDYEKTKNNVYFSPQNFYTGTANIHWRHYLNPNDLYYGALNTYYGIKYIFQFDSSKTPFNGGIFELYKDWNQHIATEFLLHGIYGSVYDDIGVFFNFVGRF